MPRKKSPKSSPKKDMISQRGEPSRRLYLTSKYLPKKINKYFKKILELRPIHYIVHLDISNRNLQDIDIEKYFQLDSFKSLEKLNCSNTRLKSLNIYSLSNLKILDCSMNFLTNNYNKNEFMTHNNTKLEILDCGFNQLVYLNIDYNNKLKKLNCMENKLKNINLNNNVLLEVINCSANHLEKIDLSKLVILSYLDCSYNKLTGLYISKNTNLITLKCHENNLKQLFINNNPYIKKINVVNNFLTVPSIECGQFMQKKYNKYQVSNYYVRYNGINNHTLNQLLYNSRLPSFDKAKMLKFPKESLIPQKLMNCNSANNLSNEDKTYIIKSHGALIDSKYLLPDGVFVITLSLAGDVIALSQTVVNKLVDFYMIKDYIIKIPYICKKYRFKTIDDIMDFLNTLSCSINGKKYITLIPTLTDINNYYKGIISPNMSDLINFGWEFTRDYNYLFKTQDHSKIRTPENLKLSEELNNLLEVYLYKWSKDEGRDTNNKLTYNIRNHLEKTVIQDQWLSFYMENCSSAVCSIDTITENEVGRKLYEGCHQFGKFKLSEFINLHGKGIYIINACRCISGLTHISQIESSPIRQASVDDDNEDDDYLYDEEDDDHYNEILNIIPLIKPITNHSK